MTTGYQTIDRRQKMACACNCGQKATLDHFRIVEHGGSKSLVLPGCEARFREELASIAMLRELVTRHCAWWQRVRHVRTVYRLQAFISERQGSRLTAWRTAAIYLLGPRIGLLLSEYWR